MYNLDRFIEAQMRDYATALNELKNGKKTSHWIWYIFPQLVELGCSFQAEHYGIEGIEEARAYMDYPVLGPRYLTCIEALLSHRERPVNDIMGGEVDAKKLQSSLTLMLAAGGGEAVNRALDTLYFGQHCTETGRLLKAGQTSF